MISIVAKFTVKEGKNEEFLKIVKELVEKSQAEAGCISYEINQHAEDTQVFAMLEEWKDQAAIDAHDTSEHFTTLVPQIGALAAVAVDVYKPL